MAYSADDKLMIFFKKKKAEKKQKKKQKKKQQQQILTFHAKLETICMKYQNVFSGENMKHISIGRLLNFYPAC